MSTCIFITKKNPSQEDFDEDGEDCDFSSHPNPYITLDEINPNFCGGDVCDIDDDNDGVLDLADDCLFTEPNEIESIDPITGCTPTGTGCTANWDCSGVPWSDCVGGVMTRDISQCTLTGSIEGCEEYEPESQKACQLNIPSEPGGPNPYDSGYFAEEDNLPKSNIWIWITAGVIVLIGLGSIGYYLIKKR